MSFKNLRKRTEGFTIIEVLIVLAIAGLILLIVFLAVPALQRNSRNTQRKNDVAGLLGAVSEYTNNNNGTLANTCSGTNPVTFNNTTPGTLSQGKVGYYNLGCAAGAATVNGHVGIVAAPAAAVANPATNTSDYVTIYVGAICSSATQAQAGTARGFAALYEIETGANTYASVCQSS